MLSEYEANCKLSSLLNVKIESSAVNLLLGCTGVGKSTLLSQVSGELLKQVKQPDNRYCGHKLVVFTAGESIGDIKWKIESYAVRKVFGFSDADPTVDSESAVVAAPGHMERYLRGPFDLEANMRVNTDPFEMWEDLVREKLNGAKLAGIVFDNLNTWADEIAGGMEGESHVVGSKAIVRGLASLGRLARVMKRPVWVSHSLKGKFGTKSPTRRFHVNDAAMCKFISPNVDNVFVIGNPDRSGRVRIDRVQPLSENAEPVIARSVGHCFKPVADREVREFFCKKDLQVSKAVDDETFQKLKSIDDRCSDDDDKDASLSKFRRVIDVNS